MIAKPNVTLSSFLIFVIVFSSFILIYSTIPCLKTSPSNKWLQKIHQENNLRFLRFYDKENSYIEERKDQGGKIEEAAHPNWDEHRTMLIIYQNLVDNYSPNNELLQELKESCIDKSEFERINDYKCRAWWLSVLTKEEIVDIGITLGFLREEHKLGAIQVIFANGLKGWFKPCGLQNEFPENEIIAGALDFLLGFHRAPPSVMRNITTDSFISIVQKKSSFFPFDKNYVIFDETYATCSENGMLRGSLTGWWEHVEDGESLPKTNEYFGRFFPESSIQEERAKLSQFDNAEQTQSHIFLFLMNILRKPGKNEFVTQTKKGKKIFLALDLDRTTFYDKIITPPTFCEACIIGNQTLNNLFQAHSFYEEFSKEFYNYVRKIGEFIAPEPLLDILYHRIDFTMSCFDSCSPNSFPYSTIVTDEFWMVHVS